MNYKLAIMAQTIEPLLMEKNQRDSLYVITIRGSAYERWCKANMQEDHSISITPASAEQYDMPLEDAIQESDLTERLHEHGITHVVLSHRGIQSVYTWAESEQLRLLAPGFSQQSELEHKIFFDNLLKTHDIPSPPTVDAGQIIAGNPYVIQQADSYGMFGTRFSTHPQISDPTHTLVRKYVEGIPVGVSIFINKEGQYFFSALRRQCFLYTNGYPQSFTGVQWIPTSYFDRKIVGAVEKSLSNLTEILMQRGYVGVANFDLLITHHEALVLECNPRLSTATTQLFAEPGLTTYEDPWKFFVTCYIGSDSIQIRNDRLPESAFEGAVLDLDIAGQLPITSVPAIGAYQPDQKTLIYISDTFSYRKLPNRQIILSHELGADSTVAGEGTLCTIISKHALFSIDSGSMNEEGRRIFQQGITLFSS